MNPNRRHRLVSSVFMLVVCIVCTAQAACDRDEQATSASTSVAAAGAGGHDASASGNLALEDAVDASPAHSAKQVLSAVGTELAALGRRQACGLLQGVTTVFAPTDAMATCMRDDLAGGLCRHHPRRPSTWWRKRGVDTQTLPDLMAAHEFEPPPEFRAFVLEITFDETRSRVLQERAFDYAGSSHGTRGWNPASTVKLFAAIAALQRAQTLDVPLSFGDRKPLESLGLLLREAIVDSDNIAYNRLVQFVGYDWLHRHFFNARNGLPSSAITGPYYRSRWLELGGQETLRDAPAVSLAGASAPLLPAREGSVKNGCARAACADLQELAEAMRRLMLQEQLPRCETFSLSEGHLRGLRRLLRQPRERGMEVIDDLADIFPERVVYYHKPGYANGWVSDVVYVFDPWRDQAWVVALGARGGRRALELAADTLGRVLAHGELRAARHVVTSDP